MYFLYRSIELFKYVYLIEVSPIEVYHIGKGAVEVSGLPRINRQSDVYKPVGGLSGQGDRPVHTRCSG